MDRRIEIHTKTIDILIKLLKTIEFTAPFWNQIYDLILGYIPKYCLHQLIEDKKFGPYIKNLVCEVIDIFCERFHVLQKKVNNFIDRINGFITETNSIIGIEIHKYFMQKIASKYKGEISWDDIILKLRKALARTLPKELIKTNAVITESNGSLRLGFIPGEVLSKSLNHLNILNYIRTTIINELGDFIPLNVSTLLIDSFNESAKLANEFNKNVELRKNLKKAGFQAQGSQLMNLSQQEKEALFGYFELSFKIYNTNPESKDGIDVMKNSWAYFLI